ncbi:MAG: LysR family transcriptional regulator [Acidihalobacter sp.]|uniref:LysR family transcriptional regulator n=1 Tax=Acidihalobacter sp. TaxID=1872108 RepID=UPI00307E3C4C
MNIQDWTLIRAFLAVATAGSVSAAARTLGVSQPTLSRQISALEQSMRLTLFERSPQGLHLTEQGEALVAAAMQMDDAADRFARLAAGLSEVLEGDVRISANEIVGYHLLPPLIAAFRREHPGVAIEVLISNRASSLSKREADIALRMFHPSQAGLVAMRLPDMELGLFAHRDLPLHLALMRAGAGIGVTHAGIAAGYPELLRVLAQAPLPTLEFWCVYHRDVRFNPRIRALARFIREWFAEDPYRALLP